MLFFWIVGPHLKNAIFFTIHTTVTLYADIPQIDTTIIAHDVWTSIIQQQGIVLKVDSNIDWFDIDAPMHM